MFVFSKSAVAAVSLFVLGANAHLAAFHEAMWCLNGITGKEDLNSYDIVTPLYQLSFKDWWFHGVNRCNQFPPAPGKFLDLPAGGSFMVEIASNRAKTKTAYGGRYTSEWPDGQTYPEDYNVPGCITSPNMHAQNHGRAAGTAFAISYVSDINQVTPQNLVVFSVALKTPWKREAWYQVPAAMPPCPPEGCICAWGWVPNGCGQPNMYHQAFRCRVTNSRSNTPVGTPKPPVWCENNPGACVKGPKQMIYWNQLEGNNVVVSGRDAAGEFKSPGYNPKMGFYDGAQNDIFTGAPSSGNSGSPAPAPAPSPSPSTGSGNTNTGSGSGSSNTGGGSSGSPSTGGGSPASPAPPAAGSPSSAAASVGTSPTSTGGSSLTSSSAPVPTRLTCRRGGKKRRELEAKRREEVRREEVRREEVRKRETGPHHHHARNAKRSF